MRNKAFHWTDSDLQKLKQLYPVMLSSEIANEIGCTVCAVYNKAHQLGLKKSEAFKNSEQSGRISKLLDKGFAFRFKKGQIPLNKGTKMPEHVYEKVKRTMFKKGHVPACAKASDGVITVRRDTFGRAYKFIRVSLGKWVPLHVHLWEQANGKLPKGMIVAFKDKDSMHCEIDNLEIITKAENMMRNTIHRYPDELKQIIKINSKIKRTINEKRS